MKASVVAKSKIMKGANIVAIVIYFHITFKKIDCSCSIKKEGRWTIPPTKDSASNKTPTNEGKIPLGGGRDSMSKESSCKLSLRPFISSFSKIVGTRYLIL